MEIRNESGEVVNISQLDLDKGYLVPSSETKKIKDEIPTIPARYRYIPVKVFFNDLSVYYCQPENDPQINIVDAQKGIFQYKLTGIDTEQGRSVLGISTQKILENAEQPGQPAEYETTEFLQYKSYSEEALLQKEEEQKRINFFHNLQNDVENILLALAEITGTEQLEER